MSLSLEVRIDGVLAAPNQIENWELRRTQAVLAKIRRALKITAPTKQDKGDLAALREELLGLKEQMGRDGLRATLDGNMRVSGFITKLVVRLSGARRKQCVVEMRVPNCAADAFSQTLNDLMSIDTAANRRINLLVCPDHYVLEPRADVLEVIETTGGSPLPAQFFMRFDDESGLKTPRDPAYPYQSVGTARLADGTVIGGVRHQIRSEGSDVLIRLMVEFPHLTVNQMIREHQWHLACEFSHWAREIKSRLQAAAPLEQV